MTPTLEVRDLRKVFRLGTRAHPEDFVAVDGVSFSIPEGGSLAIVGESGSGKTTIARIVAGLETATGGAVLVDGTKRTPIPWRTSSRIERSREVQMVFQDPTSSLDPRQTIEDALDEVLRLHSEGDTNQRAERIDELLEHVGLDARHRPLLPHRLSGGERQRAAIARALAVRPRVLVLDEAVSSLDVSVQAQVLNLLVDLRATLGLTYLFISHDLGVVRQVSDNCIVMWRSRVQEEGGTQDVLDRPTATYTKRLLEAIPGPGWKPRRHPVEPLPQLEGGLGDGQLDPGPRQSSRAGR